MKLKKTLVKPKNEQIFASEVGYKLFMKTGKISYYLFYRELENLQKQKTETNERTR